jgi:hypothetical protein
MQPSIPRSVLFQVLELLFRLKEKYCSGVICRATWRLSLGVWLLKSMKDDTLVPPKIRPGRRVCLHESGSWSDNLPACAWKFDFKRMEARGHFTFIILACMQFTVVEVSSQQTSFSCKCRCRVHLWDSHCFQTSATAVERIFLLGRLSEKAENPRESRLVSIKSSWSFEFTLQSRSICN